MAVGEAPGKVILVGEHAVVYGRPAIAVPVWQTKAVATISSGATGEGCIIDARDVDSRIVLSSAARDQPIALTARLALERLGADSNPDWRIELSSEIPMASGMGSGAAVSAALVRAIYAALGEEPAAQVVSDLVYASEELYHGTPSGIDNTVVAYGQPVWFVRGEEPVVFDAARPFTLAIADSGIPASTRETVAAVRRRRESARSQVDAWFDEIAQIAVEARYVIETGRIEALGPLFDSNQLLLERIGVSTPALEKLIAAARKAGASGAKLSGGGGGGNIIALVDQNQVEGVHEALLQAGAKGVIITTVSVHP